MGIEINVSLATGTIGLVNASPKSANPKPLTQLCINIF
jgi:hypothetical protein